MRLAVPRTIIVPQSVRQRGPSLPYRRPSSTRTSATQALLTPEEEEDRKRIVEQIYTTATSYGEMLGADKEYQGEHNKRLQHNDKWGNKMDAAERLDRFPEQRSNPFTLNLIRRDHADLLPFADRLYAFAARYL